MFDPALRLFVDDEHIRNVLGMRRVLGRIEKRSDPIVRDVPGRAAAWASALREPEGAEGAFRLWYLSVASGSAHDMAAAGAWGRGSEYGFFPERFPGALPETQLSQVRYAESDDGFTWHQPELGLHEFDGSLRNNIVLNGEAAARQTDRALTNIDAFSVLRDEAAQPNERYKLVGHWETVHVWDNIMSKLARSDADLDRFWAARAKYLLSSADGLRWDGPMERVAEASGDYGGITRDHRNGRWLFNERSSVGPVNPGIYVRTAGLRVSHDLRRWPCEPLQLLPLGEYEDFGLRFEHHGMTPFNYGDMDLGFLELSVKGTPVAAILLSHRDGQPWRFVCGHEPFLAPGAPGEPDDRLVAFTRNEPFRVGEGLLLLYNGRRVPREGQREGTIRAATLRLDGFAGMSVEPLSARRLPTKPFLQTQPLTVTRPALELNVEGHRGTARCGLYGEDLKPLPGCDLEECLPLHDDAVRAAVRWKARTDLSDLAGRRAIVTVQMESGTLWAVRV